MDQQDKHCSYDRVVPFVDRLSERDQGRLLFTLLERSSQAGQPIADVIMDSEVQSNLIPGSWRLRQAAGNIALSGKAKHEGSVALNVLLWMPAEADQEPDQFLYEAQELLRATEVVGEAPQTSYRDLVVDTNSYTAERRGVIFGLTKREFTILNYLVRHAGIVRTRENIFEHAWDSNSDTLLNSVETYICKLRKKVDGPFEGEELIHTIRGIGYRLGGRCAEPNCPCHLALNHIRQ